MLDSVLENNGGPNLNCEDHKGWFQVHVSSFHLTWVNVHIDTEAHSTLCAENLRGHKCDCTSLKKNYKSYVCLIHSKG